MSKNIKIIVKLFNDKLISSGEAAEMLGTDRVSFLLDLHKYGVNMINMEPDELESDVKNAWFMKKL